MHKEMMRGWEEVPIKGGREIRLRRQPIDTGKIAKKISRGYYTYFTYQSTLDSRRALVLIAPKDAMIK